MNAFQQGVAALTQIINSLDPLVVSLTNFSMLVLVLVGIWQNSRQSKQIATAVNAHSADITAIKKTSADIKKNTDGINSALTERNTVLVDKLINGDSTKGPTP
jgi:hypothetical protein